MRIDLGHHAGDCGITKADNASKKGTRELLGCFENSRVCRTRGVLSFTKPGGSWLHQIAGTISLEPRVAALSSNCFKGKYGTVIFRINHR